MATEVSECTQINIQEPTSGNRCKWLREKWANDRRKSSESSLRVKNSQLFVYEQKRHQSEPQTSISCRSCNESPIKSLDNQVTTADTPLTNLNKNTETSLTMPSKTDMKLKLKKNASKPFKRAFSYDTRATVDVIKKLNTTAAEDMEIEPQMPKLLQYDNGIVCSDEDLRLILSSKVNHDSCCRTSADVRREKMKSLRSLSLDSSFFRLKMKKMQTDSPNWFLKFKSQKEYYDKSAVNDRDMAEVEVVTETSIDSADNAPPFAADEITTSSVENLSHNDSATTVSTSDDESQLLANFDSPNDKVIEDKQTTMVSKVAWNEESEVDAEILGHAIEFYLTSSIKTTSNGSCRNGRGSLPDTIASLKSLFIK
ncbi:hypothetical protein CHUAL_012456 [Chamberlinius hualienensis]